MSDDIQTLEPEQVETLSTRQEIRKKRIGQSEKHAVILDQRLKGFSTDRISENTGIARSTVKDIINTFEPIFKELEHVANFRTSKADILAAAQLTALKSAFTGNKLKKASFSSTISAFAELNKAERLENNQSTDNIISNFTSNIQINVHENSISREINGVSNRVNDSALYAIDDAEILPIADIDNADNGNNSQ